MLLQEFAALQSVQSRQQLLDEFVGFARKLGFDRVGAMAVVDHFQRGPEFISIHNAPEAYCESFEDMGNARRDPVMQHCKRRSIPIVWDQSTYVCVGEGEKWESQAPFGYRTGIALAMHLADGHRFVIGVNRDNPLPSNSLERARMVADVQLFAVYAQDAALRVLLPPRGQVDIPTLTSRELESLRWTMEGKTAWETGNILGISEQTAARHINNATQKLGCVNKLQAVLKALRLRLIS